MEIDYVSKFNSTIHELIEDLIVIFPDDEDLCMFQTAIYAGCMMDSKKVACGFKKRIDVQFGDKIIAKDATLFLSDSNLVCNTSTSTIDILPKLKTIWGSLSEDDKEVVWKYLRILVVLCRKITV